MHKHTSHSYPSSDTGHTCKIYGCVWLGFTVCVCLHAGGHACGVVNVHICVCSRRDLKLTLVPFTIARYFICWDKVSAEP